ncbi:MAG: hypothetical protein ACYDBH_07480 [Acidobacteriaceae bacterium]|jgi:hypothetical protein
MKQAINGLLLSPAAKNFVDNVEAAVAQNLFVFQHFHERLAGRVVPRIALPAHTDVDSVHTFSRPV